MVLWTVSTRSTVYPTTNYKVYDLSGRWAAQLSPVFVWLGLAVGQSIWWIEAPGFVFNRKWRKIQNRRDYEIGDWSKVKWQRKTNTQEAPLAVAMDRFVYLLISNLIGLNLQRAD